MNVSVQALYYYNRKRLHGQVKLTVRNLIEKKDGSQWRRAGTSGSLSRVYVPFHQRRGEYYLSGDRAIAIEREPFSSHWETVSVQPLAYRREWYEALLSKIERSLEGLVKDCISLSKAKEKYNYAVS